MSAEWPVRRISEIATHSLGKMLDKSKNKGEPQPYLRNQNVRWFEFDLSDVAEMRILPSEHERYAVRRGDVLVCEGGYPGRAAIWESDEPIFYQKALHRVRFHEPERNKWFLYYLLFRDLEGTLKRHFNGAGIQHFTGEALAQFEMPVPPLAEQQRIVGILDEAFEGIASAKANAEQVLKGAKSLFDSRLRDVFAADFEMGTRRRLADLATDITDGDHMPPPKAEDGIPFITIGNVNKRTREIDFSDSFSVPATYFEKLKDNRRPRVGDVLYTVTGSFGIPILVKDTVKFCFQRHIALVRPKPEILPSWLYFLLLSPQVFAQADERATGTAQRTVSLTVLRDLVVPEVRLERQIQSVALLDRMFEETQALMRTAERKLAALDALKKSLLHHAFTGQL